MATDRNLQNLIINKLTKAQYDAIDSPSPDELYLIPDEIDDTPTQGSDNPVKSGGVFAALSGKQDTIDAQNKLDYSLIANTPTIPPADYVAMIDITSSVDGSGNPQHTATIVSGTLAEIEAALLAHKTVILIGRYSASNNVSYQYFHSGEHLPGVYVMFSTIGADLIPGAVVVAAWRGEDSAGPERVDIYDGTGIMEASPMGDGNAVTSIERHNLFPMLIANKDKTFVDTAQQTLTDAQKSQARTNIGAGTYSKPANGIPASDLANGVIPTVPTDIVKYTAQTLTDAQKAQARTNIGATASEIFWAEYGVTTFAEIEAANTANKKILVKYINSSGFFPITQLFALSSLMPQVMAYFYSEDCGQAFIVTQDLDTGDTEWSEPFETGVEYNSNKVTSWQNTPDNNHYPSEKLVKDSLDGKQPTIDANHKLAYSLLSGTPPEIFPVTYGTTTQSDILTAVAAGKLPLCKYGDNLYVYAGESSADYSQFTSVLYDTAYRIYVKNSTWGNGSYEVYSKPSGGIPASDLASGVVPSTYAGSPSAGGPALKALGIPFGDVDSTSTATEITATVDNFPTTLTDGVCAYIRNDVIASASGWTLNINGTGAKPVYQSLADESRVTTLFAATSTHLFIYNSSRVEGGCWDLFYGYNSNDNTIGYILRTNYMSMPVSSACYRYRLLFTSADGTQFVPANSSTSTNATAKRNTTQTPIDPFGSIRYYNYTSAVTSGSRPGVTYLAEQYQVTLGYSFNRTGAALTLTSWDPVYIKCAPQADGSAIIEAETPYVQALPTTADGKIYIYLGVATSATQVEVVFHHPVYYHDGTGVRLWTGKEASGGGGIPRIIQHSENNMYYFVKNEILAAGIPNNLGTSLYAENPPPILAFYADSIYGGTCFCVLAFWGLMYEMRAYGSNTQVASILIEFGYAGGDHSLSSIVFDGTTYTYDSTTDRFVQQTS